MRRILWRVSVLVISSGDIISGLKNQNRRGADYGNQKGSYTNRKFCALGCEILYGLSYIFTKQVTAEVSALSLLGWRFLLAFIVMSILAGTGFIKIRLKGRSVKPLLWIALFSPGIYLLEKHSASVILPHQKRSFSCVYSGCIRYAQRVFLKT